MMVPMKNNGDDNLLLIYPFFIFGLHQATEDNYIKRI